MVLLLLQNLTESGIPFTRACSWRLHLYLGLLLLLMMMMVSSEKETICSRIWLKSALGIQVRIGDNVLLMCFWGNLVCSSIAWQKQSQMTLMKTGSQRQSYLALGVAEWNHVGRRDFDWEEAVATLRWGAVATAVAVVIRSGSAGSSSFADFLSCPKARFRSHSSGPSRNRKCCRSVRWHSGHCSSSGQGVPLKMKKNRENHVIFLNPENREKFQFVRLHLFFR